MEPRSRPDPADPDFDPEPARPVRLQDLDLVADQRVVVNPFLALLALIFWWASARRLLLGAFPPSAVLASLALFGLPWLVQFHCLDCGRTGIYRRLGRHTCPGILARRREGRRSRAILPRPGTQLVLWCYLVGSTALILAVAGPSRP